VRSGEHRPLATAGLGEPYLDMEGNGGTDKLHQPVKDFECSLLSPATGVGYEIFEQYRIRLPTSLSDRGLSLAILFALLAVIVMIGSQSIPVYDYSTQWDQKGEYTKTNAPQSIVNAEISIFKFLCRRWCARYRFCYRLIF
jgi:hypothetical protein